MIVVSADQVEVIRYLVLIFRLGTLGKGSVGCKVFIFLPFYVLFLVVSVDSMDIAVHSTYRKVCTGSLICESP